MIKNFYIILLLLVSISCVEELDLAVSGQDELPNILIVEATITDELKFHQIRLSKVDSLLDLGVDNNFNPFAPGLTEEDIAAFDLVPHEENAQVSISISDGSQISFVEGNPGTYISSQVFQVQEGLEYELRIKTTDNRDFISKPMGIEGNASIENIYAEKVTLTDGGEGVEIFVDSNEMNGNAENLRFSFEETYKIIAPNWTGEEFKLTNYDPCAVPVTYDLEIVPSPVETRVCYGSRSSQNVILNDKDVSSNGGLNRFSIQVLGQNNFKISHRYSIEVSQLVTGAESFGFYEKLKNFSQNGSVFSQIQPGFLEGNISSADGKQGTVIGFFDIASVTKKRLFFNYKDFFPDEELPDYPINCGLHSSPESHVSFCFTGEFVNNCPFSIIERVDLDNIAYVAINDENIGTCPGPYIYVAKPCGDCTLLGSNVEPDFWTE